jgi:large subunit ribosomal protein L30
VATKKPAKQSASAKPDASRSGKKGSAVAKRLKVTQIRSGIGFDRKQSLALRGLGLRRLHHTVEVPDTPSSRGLILKVRHLVVVNE